LFSEVSLSTLGHTHKTGKAVVAVVLKSLHRCPFEQVYACAGALLLCSTCCCFSSLMSFFCSLPVFFLGWFLLFFFFPHMPLYLHSVCGMLNFLFMSLFTCAQLFFCSLSSLFVYYLNMVFPFAPSVAPRSVCVCVCVAFSLFFFVHRMWFSVALRVVFETLCLCEFGIFFIAPGPPFLPSFSLFRHHIFTPASVAFWFYF
jgi:hypothetical protein